MDPLIIAPGAPVWGLVPAYYFPTLGLTRESPSCEREFVHSSEVWGYSNKTQNSAYSAVLISRSARGGELPSTRPNWHRRFPVVLGVVLAGFHRVPPTGIAPWAWILPPSTNVSTPVRENPLLDAWCDFGLAGRGGTWVMAVPPRVVALCSKVVRMGSLGQSTI